MIALDTHILMCLVTSPEKLSQKAQKLINREVKSAKPLLVSSISIWEICMLVKKGRLKLSMDVDAWLEKIEKKEAKVPKVTDDQGQMIIKAAEEEEIKPLYFNVSSLEPVKVMIIQRIFPQR